MIVVKQILNSEGILLAIAKEGKKFFLMVKEHRRNEYSYFPLDKDKLISYLNSEITLAEVIPNKDSFSCVHDYYNALQRGLLANSKQEILDVI